jgi:hypothetical protein
MLADIFWDLLIVRGLIWLKALCKPVQLITTWSWASSSWGFRQQVTSLTHHVSTGMESFWAAAASRAGFMKAGGSYFSSAHVYAA